MLEELDQLNAKIKQRALVKTMREQHNLKFEKSHHEFFSDRDAIYISLLSTTGGEIKFRAEFPPKDQAAQAAAKQQAKEAALLRLASSCVFKDDATSQEQEEHLKLSRFMRRRALADPRIAENANKQLDGFAERNQPRSPRIDFLHANM